MIDDLINKIEASAAMDIAGRGKYIHDLRIAIEHERRGGEPADPTLAPYTDLLAYVLQDDIHNRLTPRVIDIAYTAFMCAIKPNDEDGGPSDWFNDTKPVVTKAIDKLRKDLFADREKL